MPEPTTMHDLDRMREQLAETGWATTISSLPAYTAPGLPENFYGHRTEVHSASFNGKRLPRTHGIARVEIESKTYSSINEDLQSIIRYTTGANPPKISLIPPHHEVLTAYPVSIAETSSPAEIMEYMMGLGWGYSDNISQKNYRKPRTPTLKSHHFSRNDWHGRLALNVTFPTIADLNADWGKIYYQQALKALQAWEDFPDSVPHTNIYGQVKEDVLKTRLFREQS